MSRKNYGTASPSASIPATEIRELSVPMEDGTFQFEPGLAASAISTAREDGLQLMQVFVVPRDIRRVGPNQLVSRVYGVFERR